MTIEIPKPANSPKNLEETYEWSNGAFDRGTIDDFGSSQLETKSVQDRIQTEAERRHLPHPNIAARMKTMGGRTIDQLVIDDPSNPYAKHEPTPEQIAEELELIAGTPSNAEGLPSLGGAIKEIDDTHEAISNQTTPNWINRFKAFMLESQQFRPEIRLDKLGRDRKYLVQRAMYLMGIDPRTYETLDDEVLATLITAQQDGARIAAEQNPDTPE